MHQAGHPTFGEGTDDRDRSCEDDGAVVRPAPGVGADHGRSARADGCGAGRARLPDVSALDRDGRQGGHPLRGGMERGEGLETAAPLGPFLETGRVGGKSHGAPPRRVRAGARSARPRVCGGSPGAAGGSAMTGPDHRAHSAPQLRVHGLQVALALVTILVLLAAEPARSPGQPAKSPVGSYQFDDSHFHLTNYIQEGISVRQYLSIMGKRVGRSTLFGIPLQQQWSYRISGKQAPTYYLDTDARLYYYSFTDAAIAMAYKSLTPAEQARFDPMITGFNPTDMYAADHIRRVLQTFPGVFSGIGEFTIHKEFVSSKIAGDVASLTDPALDRILDFAGDVGLVVLIHNDMHVPFAKPEKARIYFEEMKALLRRHPKTTIIWAHMGLGRVVGPVQSSAAALTVW